MQLELTAERDVSWFLLVLHATFNQESHIHVFFFSFGVCTLYSLFFHTFTTYPQHFQIKHESRTRSPGLRQRRACIIQPANSARLAFSTQAPQRKQCLRYLTAVDSCGRRWGRLTGESLHHLTQQFVLARHLLFMLGGGKRSRVRERKQIHSSAGVSPEFSLHVSIHRHFLPRGKSPRKAAAENRHSLNHADN